MANPFYQPPIPRTAAVGPARMAGTPRFAGRMIHRVVRLARALCLPGRRDCRRQDDPGRDVLWRAKCNALHRALADHDLTTPQARAILCRLSAAHDHGCELARLAPLTGVDAGVLDRAVPLLGLQNFIAVRELRPEGPSGPILWVSATEHGRRYEAEAFAALSSGARENISEERA